MTEFTCNITDPQGLHARPVAKLCAEALNWESTIIVSKSGMEPVNARNPLDLLSLGALYGDEVSISIEGADEDAAAAAIREIAAGL